MVHRAERRYLRDAWNWLDFMVVVSGLIEMSPVVSLIPNVTFLRVVRVLRPLRSSMLLFLNLNSTIDI